MPLTKYDFPLRTLHLHNYVAEQMSKIGLYNPIRDYYDLEYVQSIIKNNSERKWRQLMLVLGHPYLIFCLKFFEENEDYEDCAMIVNAIRFHNELCGDDLPTDQPYLDAFLEATK